MHLMRDGGMDLKIFSQMMKELPSDTKLVGFGSDASYGLEYVMVTSKEFKDLQEGYRPSEITAYFESQWSEANGYEAVFKRLDMSDAIEKSNCCQPWQMKKYTGLMDSYNYCSVCGKKEKK